MFYLRHLILFAFISVASSAYAQSQEVQNEVKHGANELEDIYSTVPSDFDALLKSLVNNNITAEDDGKVEVKLYYESHCPFCVSFIKEKFSPAFLKLSQYVDFHMYPYGNAETIIKNGEIEFDCQHGPPECYGNKLHACAIDHLTNITEAVMFNSCMMVGNHRGSDDAAADRCAAALGIDSTPIKTCAKGDRGTELLEYYGKKSKYLSYVPYVTVNGQENDRENFLRDICAAFAVSPPPCVEFSSV